MIEITYKGNNISLNKFYTMHWAVKQKKKEEILNSLSINQTEPIIKAYTVDLSYHSRLDVDNNVSLVKIVLDSLRRSNLLIDDNTKYLKSLSISFNPALEKNEYRIIIKNEGSNQ